MGTSDRVQYYCGNRPVLRDKLYLEVGLNPSEVLAVETLLKRSMQQWQFRSATGQNQPRVFIRRLRQKLKPFGVEIKATGGARGDPSTYFLTQEAKEKLYGLL